MQVIQNGDNTHHHDQVITLHSLSTIKASSNKLPNEIPDDFLLLIFVWFYRHEAALL